MKELLNKKELKALNTISYNSKNPNVNDAVIIKYKYQDKYLYQPIFRNSDNERIIDRTAYYTEDEAKKSIDNYNYKIN